MLPQIRQVAADKHATVIDVNFALQGIGKDVPDGIHPNAAGAKLLAETVAAAMKR